MTTYTPKRHERGTTLHRYCVRDDDVQGFGWALIFWGGVLALATGVAYIVAVYGFGASPWFPLEWIK